MLKFSQISHSWDSVASPDTPGNQSPQGAFVTMLDRMHLVHTLVFFTWPEGLMILTLWRLGNEIFFVRLWAWLTLYPLSGPLPHISQTRDINNSLKFPSGGV